MNATIDEIKGRTLAVLNEWACRYEPEMFAFLGLPDVAVAKFAHRMIEQIRADIIEEWTDSDSAALYDSSEKRIVYQPFRLNPDAPITQYIRDFKADGVSDATRKFHTEYQVNAAAHRSFADANGCDSAGGES
jgi:hypothetical protein